MRRLIAACAATFSSLVVPQHGGAEVDYEVDRFSGKKKINMHLDCKGTSQYSISHRIPSCYLFSNGAGYRSIVFSIAPRSWALLDVSNSGSVNAIFNFKDGSSQRGSMS